MIAVIRLSHISNFTDFHALNAIKHLQLVFIDSVMDLSRFDAVIIPGSKNTRDDIQWLKSNGWADKLQAYADSDGCILGICGGYQIMGETVNDPEGLEGRPGTTRGLNLLPVKTTLQTPKMTTISEFSWYGVIGKGYEIHMGSTERMAGYPFFKVHARNRKECSDFDGCVSENHRIMGTYMHGMFDSIQITRQWLKFIRLEEQFLPELPESRPKDHNYTLLKEHFEKHVNMDKIFRL